MSMFEKVARAIYATDPLTTYVEPTTVYEKNVWVNSQRQAKAAIKAMREPNDVMVFAGCKKEDEIEHDLETYVSDETTDWDQGSAKEAIYQAMVNAALSEISGLKEGEK